MFGVGIIILILLVVYGIKGMATLAIFIDKLKFGSKGAVISDNIPPAPPTIWADYTATNSATVKIYGISEPDSKISLLNDNQIILETKADDEGKLTFESVTLKPGSNNFMTIAIDGAGNKSHESKSLIVTFSDKNPDLTIEKPSENQRFSGSDNPIEIKGKTVVGAKVYINGRLAIADGSGGFLLKIYLKDGDNVLMIRVVDEALNETNKEIKVYYQP